MMMGAIVDRKLLCVGCKKAFLVKVSWHATVETIKDIDHA
jgi:hypothetical protein